MVESSAKVRWDRPQMGAVHNGIELRVTFWGTGNIEKKKVCYATKSLQERYQKVKKARNNGGEPWKLCC